jgi:predicted ABC-type exoprotein transport system permease subunit
MILFLITILLGIILLNHYFTKMVFGLFAYDSPYSGGLLTNLFVITPIICILQTLYGMSQQNIFIILLTLLYYPIIEFLLNVFKNGEFTKKCYDLILNSEICL